MGPHVSFFATCLADTVFPEVARDAVLLLEEQGCRVDFNPRQTCCGQPLTNAGFHGRARKAMELQMEVLLGEEAEYIVCPSGSCVLQIREYPRFFQHDPVLRDKARRLGEKTYELTDFLVNVLGVDDLGARLDGRAAYHPSCHLTRMLGVRKPPLTLLSKVKGLELVDFKGQEKCCGFGGTFAVKLGPLSGAMAEEKVENIREAGVDYLIGADAGCLLNLEGVIRRKKYPIKVLHLTRVLRSRES